jgi:ribosome-interacting GTPase 1
MCLSVYSKPANVSFKIKSGGGVSFMSLVECKELTEDLCRNILHVYKIHNADILVREDCTVDEFIDIIEGTCPSVLPI